MKVLVVSHLYPSPGYDRHLFVHEQVLALKEAGAGVRVVSPTGYGAARAVAQPRRCGAAARRRRRAIRDGVLASYPRVPVLPRRLLFSRSGDLYYLGMRRELAALRQEGVDLVHAHQALPDGAAAAAPGPALGVPYVVTVHGADVNVALPGGGATAARVAAVLAERGRRGRRLGRRGPPPGGLRGARAPARHQQRARRRRGAGARRPSSPAPRR